jgi:transglycosylase-like protein with SLT domain
MTAQRFQESSLNQNAQSKVGAIDVMQVMPETGKDPNVGDISQLEPDIHAGVKFVRLIIDRNFKAERRCSWGSELGHVLPVGRRHGIGDGDARRALPRFSPVSGNVPVHLYRG